MFFCEKTIYISYSNYAEKSKIETTKQNDYFVFEVKRVATRFVVIQLCTDALNPETKM